MSNLLKTNERAVRPPEYIRNTGEVLLAVRFDVTQLLLERVGSNWQEVVIKASEEHGELKVRQANDPTCREADPSAQFGLITMEGEGLASLVPGIWDLYNTDFKDMMQQSLPEGAEEIGVYTEPRLGLECVAQLPQPPGGVISRLEAHVDQRATAVLAIDVPDSDDEGALVIGNNPYASTVEEINSDSTRIVHIPGTLLCFSRGSLLPHYTEIIEREGSRRLVVALNYPFSSETPEVAERMYQQIQGIGGM